MQVWVEARAFVMVIWLNFIFVQLGGSPDAHRRMDRSFRYRHHRAIRSAQSTHRVRTRTHRDRAVSMKYCHDRCGRHSALVTSFLTTSNGQTWCADPSELLPRLHGAGTRLPQPGNGDVMMDCAPIDVTYTQPGSYDVTLIIDANNGCGADTVTIVDAVTVYTRPLAAFDQLPAQLNTLDPVAFFNNTTNVANTYAWLINGEFITDEVDMQYRFPGEYFGHNGPLRHLLGGLRGEFLRRYRVQVHHHR